MELLSLWTVTDFKTGKQYDEEIVGAGEPAIKFLRKEYPKFSKFVLEGFKITTDGKTIYKRVNLRTYNNIR